MILLVMAEFFSRHWNSFLAWLVFFFLAVTFVNFLAINRDLAFALSALICMYWFVILPRQSKIELMVMVKWQDLMKHPQFPQEYKAKVEALYKKTSSGKTYDYKLFPVYLRYVIDGSRNSMWSDNAKTVLPPQTYGPDEMGVDLVSMKVFWFLSHRFDEKSDDDKGVSLEISENKNFVEFRFAEAKEVGSNRTVICKFPSFVLFNKKNPLTKATLQKYGFKTEEVFPGKLEFENDYFDVEIVNVS